MQTPPTDAELVAHMDGELAAEKIEWMEGWLARDTELRARYALLARGGRPFREAFDLLLVAAPQAGLEAKLEELPAQTPARKVLGMGAPPSQGAFPPAWRRWGLIAAGVLLFLSGAVVQRELPALREATGIGVGEEAEIEWREAAAEYVSLYTAETLSGIPDDTAPRERELAVVGARLGVALSPSKVSLPGLALKRAQLLQYDGKPLGQIAYLDPKDGALVLCIYVGTDEDKAPATEQRVGLNIVHWSSRGRAFMLIGRMPTPRLQDLASLLSRQLVL